MTKLTKAIKRLTEVAASTRKDAPRLCVGVYPPDDEGPARIRVWRFGSREGYELSIAEAFVFFASIEADREAARKRRARLATQAEQTVKRFGLV